MCFDLIRLEGGEAGQARDRRHSFTAVLEQAGGSIDRCGATQHHEQSGGDGGQGPRVEQQQHGGVGSDARMISTALGEESEQGYRGLDPLPVPLLLDTEGLVHKVVGCGACDGVIARGMLLQCPFTIHAWWLLNAGVTSYQDRKRNQD